MGFHNLITKAVYTVSGECIDDGGSVCELGNQTIKNGKARRAIYKELGIANPDPQTVKEWYNSIGFTNYIAIDVNEEKDAVAMDLNLDLKKDYNFTDTFDLVTNNGTGEHVFNQYTVFKNTHDLCKVGGYMIHCLPFYRWVDHGFYNYNPNLFIALASANNYMIKTIWIGQNDAARIEEIDVTRVDRYSGYREDYELDTWEKDPSVVAVLKKTNDEPFKTPMQYLYAGDNIDSKEIKERYDESFYRFYPDVMN